jgi:hypothetical protein
MNVGYPFVLAILLSTATITAQDAKPALHFSGKVSALAVPAERLGSQWTGPTGLVIDNFKDLSDQTEEAKEVAEELKKQVSAIGVVQTGDFTYAKKFNALHEVTLRVFVFDSEQSCRNWWKKKYQYEGWEKEYAAVVGVPYQAVDSKQGTKRAAALGNVWITCGALDKTDDHLKVLDLYLDKIKAASATR